MVSFKKLFKAPKRRKVKVIIVVRDKRKPGDILRERIARRKSKL